MGSIITRKRQDGTLGFRAQILLKKAGKIVYREAKTFNRKEAARSWIARRETELSKPGALDKKDDPTLAIVIDQYIAESKKKIGRTKSQVLDKIKEFDVANKRCSEITSADIVALARDLPVSPQTVSNYLSHLGSVFSVARPAWGYPLDQSAMKDAMVVTRKLGLSGKSKSRDRRPTLDELDKLMVHFGAIKASRPATVPMQKIVAFAIFSTRRQEEITTIAQQDLDAKHHRILVRDMKHPGDKIGNDTWCDLPQEALQIVQSMRHGDKRIFPYTTDAISAAFTRACKFLNIDDLHFHDLRHDGISRLFEMGWNIPQVATVSGHRSWASLKRYTHMRESGDKYADWKWLSVVTA